jgi:hypothetical protein
MDDRKLSVHAADRVLAVMRNYFGLKLIAVVDERALARNRSPMVKRNKSQVRVHHPAA